jgi:hypothetical protein
LGTVEPYSSNPPGTTTTIEQVTAKRPPAVTGGPTTTKNTVGLLRTSSNNTSPMRRSLKKKTIGRAKRSQAALQRIRSRQERHASNLERIEIWKSQRRATCLRMHAVLMLTARWQPALHIGNMNGADGTDEPAASRALAINDIAMLVYSFLMPVAPEMLSCAAGLN